MFVAVILLTAACLQLIVISSFWFYSVGFSHNVLSSWRVFQPVQVELCQKPN